MRLREELERRVEERTQDLNRSLLDKTTLLQEVHHRVKNKQIVCSLLSMQINCLEPSIASRHLDDAYSRVFAMATVHEQLYLSESLAEIDFDEYIRKLSGKLFSACCVQKHRIHLDLSTKPTVITLDQAIPCGPILNELVSNSLKHALRDGREGTLRISLRTDGNRVEIEVADNGIGLPRDFRLGDGSSLGLKVVQILIRQLRADLVISHEGGTAFRFGWNLLSESG